MSFFRLLLLFFLIYFVYRMLSRIFFPASRTSASQGNQKRKEGEVTIDYVEKKNTKKDSDKGDYVEYEEVD